MSNAIRQIPVVRWEESSLWNRVQQPLSMGCTTCEDLPLCGGLRLEAPVYDCKSYCCMSPKTCRAVCPKSVARFVDYRLVVDGYELDNVPRAPRIEHPALPTVVPLIGNGTSRDQPLRVPVVALPLFRIVQARSGKVRFQSKEELCRHFKVPSSAFVIASGVAVDSPLEWWWHLGDRGLAIQRLKAAGVDLVTTPNYSLFNAIPRWDNFYGMKRIALAWSEFQRGGVAAALHINASSQRDYDRWTQFISERVEVATIAFEFGTGAGFPGRIEQHVQWLCEVAKNVERPLTLIIRGGQDFLGQFARSFAQVVFLDSASFIKAQKRRRAEIRKDGRLVWRSSPTLPGISLDALLADNVRTREIAIRRGLGSPRGFVPMAGTAARRKAGHGDEKSRQVGALREIELPDGWR